MNFKTYLEILESEGLEESPLADGLLIEAMNAQKQLKRYEGYKATDAITKEIERLEKIKLSSIWEAIDLARMYPPNSDMHNLVLRRFKRQNSREYKGFLYEYRIMRETGSDEGEVKYYIPPELQPVADRISKRWEEAMERQKG